MTVQLTIDECRLILESLEYSKKAVRETAIEPSGIYPSAEFKEERMVQLEKLIVRMRKLRDELRDRAG